MVNASLNWASIVGIVLAVCGGGLYFLRSFKPALARDYDVFFAAIGLFMWGNIIFPRLEVRSHPSVWSVFVSRNHSFRI